MAHAIFGAVMGIVAILGLMLASAAKDGAMHIAGFLLFLFAIINIFVLIRKLTEPRREKS